MLQLKKIRTPKHTRKETENTKKKKSATRERGTTQARSLVCTHRERDRERETALNATDRAQPLTPREFTPSYTIIES